MAEPTGKIFRARKSFIHIGESGNPRRIPAGQLVREGHPVIDGNEHLFELETNAVMEVPEDHTPKRRPGRPPKTEK